MDQVSEASGTQHSPRERVMQALHGGCPAVIPFTVYDEKVPQGSVRADLTSRGMGLVKRVASYVIHRPNVMGRAESFVDEHGRQMNKTIYSTPYGDLSTVEEPAGFTTWRHEHFFKTPDDYRALLFVIQDSVVEANYEYSAGVAAKLGDEYVVRDNLPLEPMQSLISSHLMSMEDFCIQWMDNRDEILKLYEAQVEVNRSIYPIVAAGPHEFANYGGNVTPQIIGVETFREYYIPHYNEAAEIFHRNGKLLGCHFDADNTPIMSAIAETDLDYIEAYDAGISPPIKVAREAWPDKVIWTNWPSSWHLLPEPEVKQRTHQLIEEAAPGNGFIIGVTEDVPEDRWAGNYSAILDAIDYHSRGGSAAV